MSRPPLWLFALVLAAMLLLACSGDGDEAAPTATPADAATAAPAASPAAPATPATAPPDSPPPPATTAPPASGASTPRPTARPEVPLPTGTVAPPAPPAAGERREPAPIESIDVIWSDTAPRQFWLDVTSGLPNGCARFGGIEVARAGTTITLTVTNFTSAGQNRACTQIYGYISNTVALGTDFVPGTRYTIRVNDRQESFIAP